MAPTALFFLSEAQHLQARYKRKKNHQSHQRDSNQGPCYLRAMLWPTELQNDSYPRWCKRLASASSTDQVLIAQNLKFYRGWLNALVSGDSVPALAMLVACYEIVSNNNNNNNNLCSARFQSGQRRDIIMIRTSAFTPTGSPRNRMCQKRDIISIYLY